MRTILILLLSSLLVVLVTWFVPAFASATQNALFRVRGPLPLANDIVIVAIDDTSMQQIGQWPWPRHVMAQAIEKLTEVKPAAIGLDVIYAEPTNPVDDEKLKTAIANNQHVILPAQLFEEDSQQRKSIEWLRPLPDFAAGLAGLGHAHVAPNVDGMVRSIQLSKADARGDKLWAFSLAVLRTADGIRNQDIREAGQLLRFGPYAIPVMDETASVSLPGVSVIRPNEMLINFAGPTGSFPQYSFTLLLQGGIPAAALANKIVLIGAVAASMGDSRVVPFMHYQSGEREGGEEMPGVEIHANIINSIRHGLTLRAMPEWAGFACAFAVILLVALSVERFAGWRQLSLLALILGMILVASYLLFAKALWIPPLAPMLIGYLAIVPLLLNRALRASAELDRKLVALVESQKGFLPEAKSATNALKAKWESLWPRSLNWKLQAVDDLTTQLVARMSFINRTLGSMNEGVLVTDLSGRIIYLNREAQILFGGDERLVLQAELVEFLGRHGKFDNAKLNEAIHEALHGQNAQLEFSLTQPVPKHFTLSLSPLATEHEPQRSIGVVALLADITKRVELDRMKTETLQLVSHELRTPLTSIQGLSDVLLKFPVNPEQTREMHSTIHQEAVRLGETINRYLDLTRLESGVQTLRIAPVEIAELWRDALRNVSGFAVERNVKIDIEQTANCAQVNADGQMLLQAVTNLLSNAIKYSPPDTVVRLSARDEGTMIVLRVADQGFGIPDKARERVFEKFYRLERDSESTTVGTGLGLALVKEIVELHHGNIVFENGNPIGTTFVVSLPKLQPSA